MLRDAGVCLPAVCGGRGTCGGCAVRVDPPPLPGPADKKFFSSEQLRAGYRLACLAPAVPRAAVFVPAAQEAGPEAPFWAAGRRKESPALRLAVDAGTTTVACALVQPETGRILAHGAAPNEQGAFGGDVIARIEYASRGKKELARLRDALAQSVRAAAKSACRAAGAPEESLRGGAVAGNPAMIHFLSGADPTGLGRAPFSLAFTGPVLFPAGALGFPGDPAALVSVLPMAGVTMGGDAIGGAVALGMDRGTVPRLLLDVGTNAEMILVAPRGAAAANERLGGRAGAWAASAASGAAFEGAGISCGMAAGPGAITGARWEEKDIRFRVEGGGLPLGLAGSGLVDLVAILLRFGLLDGSGRLATRREVAGIAPFALAGRLIEWRGGEAAFLIARAAGRVLALTASDVRRFQLAKGAIRAGIETLLAEGRAAPESLERVFLAGAFGHGLDAGSAAATGLVPPAFLGKLARAGNAALAAACLAAADPDYALRAARFARRMKVVELAGHREFPSRFLSFMAFPAPFA